MKNSRGYRKREKRNNEGEKHKNNGSIISEANYIRKIPKGAKLLIGLYVLIADDYTKKTLKRQND